MIPDACTAVRNGTVVSIPVADLVPGDIIMLASGDKVPADARLIQIRSLMVEEAALTGESVPVEKALGSVNEGAGLGDRSNMLFGGTLVTYGTGTAVVVETGTRTELGRISELLDSAADLETPLTKALTQIGKIITIAIVVISLAMLAIGTVRSMNELGLGAGEALRETAIFAIALAVGAIPEGLPAIVTIALAIGVQRMAARRAVIRKLPAAETLGSTTVICSDKTGTLTRNEMTVQALWTPLGSYEISGVGYDPAGEVRRDGQRIEIGQDVQRLVVAGLLCNDSTINREGNQWLLTGDPTEGALVVAAHKISLDVPEVRAAHPRCDAIPFESENQFMATLHQPAKGEEFAVVKGAPEVVLAKCALPPQFTAQTVLDEVDRLAADGMRVLAFARRPLSGKSEIQFSDVESGLEFVGLQGMIDPPRTEAIEAIAACHRAGIEVKMITGDHKGTAAAIGRQLGILTTQPATTGGQLAEMNDEELETAALSTNVFARVSPEHKLRLVRALQARGAVVAMTGDGVNDAPALKQANIGVAMGITGTSVTKEAADVVLTDDNFASIAAAVEEGRRVYDNLIKSLAFVLPTNLGLALILMVAVAFFPFVEGQLLVPMLPTQLLWINLVATVALALPLAFEAKEPNLMARSPRDPHAPVLSNFVVFRTFLAAILMTLGAIFVFRNDYSTAIAAGAPQAVALAKAQTMAVTTVIAFQIFYMLNCRSLKDSIFRIGIFSNNTVFVGVSALVVLQATFIYAPPLQAIFNTASLSARDIGLATLAGAAILPVISVEKLIRGRLKTST
jgi:Ca2+-transporting ATPase